MATGKRSGDSTIAPKRELEGKIRFARCPQSGHRVAHRHYKTGRHGTIAEVLIALEVIDSNLDGRPHSMKSLSSKLGIPYTSVSSIVYSLTSEAQPGGVLKLVPDSKDRRRKHIELDTDAFKRSAPQMRALEKAMIEYYGSSVYKLKKNKSN